MPKTLRNALHNFLPGHLLRHRAPAAALAALLALSACATPETRVRTGLMDAGLPPPLAACMADRMVDRLSLVQLRRLQSLSKVRGADLHRLSIDQFLHKVRALEDPEIFVVTSKAALSCAISG
ncbi:hypothetical protein [Sphingobium aquiterrae]|uniref:hypothetical protein n=1 Tax=Sphingobium aquiterrae TaxID=2038656 RepID=UPI003019CF54